MKTLIVAALLLTVGYGDGDPYKMSVSRMMEMSIENEALNRERIAEYHKAIKRRVKTSKLLVSRVRWINARNAACYDIEKGAILVGCLNNKLKERITAIKKMK